MRATPTRARPSPAQLNVTFTNTVGTQKVQNRGISIPRR